MIAEPPRVHYAVAARDRVGLAALALLAVGTPTRAPPRRARARGRARRPRPRRAAAALVGKDYVVERNLLPALVPLAAVVALGLGATRARLAGVLVAVALCAYWLAFDVYVTQTPNLQRPDYRGVADARSARPGVPRAIVSWRLAGDPLRWYLDDGAMRWYGGAEAVREVDLVGKRTVAEHPANAPACVPPGGGRADGPPDRSPATSRPRPVAALDARTRRPEDRLRRQHDRPRRPARLARARSASTPAPRPRTRSRAAGSGGDG